MKKGGKEDEESKLESLEIERVVNGMKNGKEVAGDGIASEVWKFWGGEVRKWVWEFCNMVWKGEG